MPKMKSHSGTKKRFRKTGTGKLMRAKAFKSHILSKKSTKRKRGFRQETETPLPTARSSSRVSPKFAFPFSFYRLGVDRTWHVKRAVAARRSAVPLCTVRRVTTVPLRVLTSMLKSRSSTPAVSVS